MKIVPSLLLIATVFGLTLLTGCDEGMQMMKPAIEKPVPPEMEPEPPMEPQGLSLEEAWKKADGILIRTVNRLEKELGEQGTEFLFNDQQAASLRNTIIFEETGLEWELITTLLKIYLEEDPHSVKIHLEDADSIAWKLGWGNITVHYLSDTFRYPTKTEDEILEMFREKCRSGGTTAIWDDVMETHFSDRLIDRNNLAALTTYVFRFRDTPASEARSKAQGIVAGGIYVTGPGERVREALTKYIQRDIWEPHDRNIILFCEAENKIILEETGLVPELVDNLVQIHLDDTPTVESHFIPHVSQTIGGKFTFISDVVAKYLELTFTYPTKTESEIMDMFREVVEAGNTTVHFKTVLDKYYPGLYDSIHEEESTIGRDDDWLVELIEEVENEFEKLQNE